MANRWEGPRNAARSPTGRGARRSFLRLLLARAAAVGFLAYLIPLYDVVLANPAAHASDRARSIPLARYLQADHDLTATRGSLPRLAVLAAAAEPPRLPQPVLVEPRRLDDPDSPGGHPRPPHRADLSRSPPGR